MPLENLRGRVFYLIRLHDAELAENFVTRCHDVQTLEELNQYFYREFAARKYKHRDNPAHMLNVSNVDEWCNLFVLMVMPLLKLSNFQTPHTTAPRYEDPMFLSNLVGVV